MAAWLLLANVHSTGKLEAWLILAIVRADRLEHATLLPGKMAALLLLANVTVYFIFISVEQTIV
jgi:hypothetical protein